MGKTQAEVAEASGIKAPNLSAIEKREAIETIEISTLQKYARALEGELEVAVVVGGRRYVLA